jgi:hypothetical protein
VNVFVVKLVRGEIEFLGGCPNISLLEEIGFDCSIDTGDKGKAADVKLPLLV